MLHNHTITIVLIRLEHGNLELYLYCSFIILMVFLCRLTGNPGAYYRIGPYRLDECSTYGCMLELTIQLGIIFVGKQALNDMTELGVP